MRKFKRLEAPDFLAANSEAWGQAWKNRREANESAIFHWHVLDGEPVNQKLLPVLKAQVQKHCSFCDAFPVNPPSIDTIEHFKPKTRFPLEAYEWENLYYCCCFCQGKRDEFDDSLLRPDSDEFDFDRFFRWDFCTGEILVNDSAGPEYQKRAGTTIRIYRLNEEHPSLRRRELFRRSRAKDQPLDDFAYRHYVDYPAASDTRLD